jgi:nucleotide-binding universal stress UspA family protein
MAVTTIVAGCDLSAPGDAALERAAAIAAGHGAALVVVHALADDSPPVHTDNALAAKLGEVSAAVRAAEALRLAEKLAALQARGVAAELASTVGPPGEVLAQIAAERDAELIVIGTHGHTGLARFLLGSVATATLRHAPCDVLVCRGPLGGAFTRPLVAIDFSAAATRALGHVAELARGSAADKAALAIDLVHAWQLPAGSWGATLLGQARFPWSTVRDAVLASARSQLDRLIASQAKLGVELRGELIQGPPASVVTAAAERGGHDLIAVGTHGHRGFRRLLLGSVAEDVIRHSPCSVLVVHGEHAGETARFRKQ